MLFRSNGILNVSAKDLGTKKEKSIKVEASSGLSKDEVERMRKDAEVHAEDDKQKRKVIDLKNSSDHLIYTTEKFLTENSASISEKDKTRTNAIIDRLKSARDKEDAEGMTSAQAELQKVSQEVGKAMYEKAAAGAAGGGQSGSSEKNANDASGSKHAKGEDEVIDADYEVKG